MDNMNKKRRAINPGKVGQIGNKGDAPRAEGKKLF
jgi:hypothetical protein